MFGKLNSLVRISFLGLLLISLIEGRTASLGRIHVRNKWLVDEYNRVRIFHGINSVEKGFPWYCSNILNKTRLALLEQWGFNVVRLGVMWAGYEPLESQFNDTYIKIIQDIVSTLNDHGMYSLLDMHQDVISSKFEAYDGVPLWLIKKFSSSKHNYPWPLQNITKDNWALGYLTEAVSYTFQQLYDNSASAVDSFGKFWHRVAQTFRTYSSVLGYELINEPWAGDIYTHPSLLLPGVAGRDNLLPLYNKIVPAIRAVDNDTLIFYEPVTWAVFSDGSSFGTGFSSVPGGDADRSVLAYHYYCWLIQEVHGPSRYPLWERVICDTLLGSRVMPSVLKDISKIGGSSFLTEFGLCEPDGDSQSLDTIECEFILSEADKYMQSWAYWDAALFNESSGQINYNVVKALSRVYPRAISGEPLSFHFDAKTAEFNFRYKLDVGIKYPTEVFVPQLHYKSGFKVFTSPGMSWHFEAKTSVLFVINKNLTTSQAVDVKIIPVPN